MPFWGPHDGRQHFEVQIPQKPSKNGLLKHVQASANGLKTNDVIEDWRHWPSFRRLLGVIGRATNTSYSSLQSPLFCISNDWAQRTKSISWCTKPRPIRYEIQFSKCSTCTAFVGALLYRVCRNMIPHHFPIHSNKLWFHVHNEITLISANLVWLCMTNIQAVKLWPVVWPCTMPDVFLRPIGTNFGLLVRLVDVINCAKFYRNRLRGLDSMSAQSLTIPIGLRCRR